MGLPGTRGLYTCFSKIQQTQYVVKTDTCKLCVIFRSRVLHTGCLCSHERHRPVHHMNSVIVASDYRIVQVKKNRFSLPRMPLAISSQRVNIWYHSDPHDQWMRVTWPTFFSPASGCLQELNSYRPMTGVQLLQ